MRSILALSCFLVACGGSTSASSDAGSADSSADVPVVDTSLLPSGVAPPPRPVTAAAGSTRWFVVSKLRLGLSDPATGLPSTTAWRRLGYDIDGRNTTNADSKANANTCKRVAGAPTQVLTDGDNGRDDNFGQFFMIVMHSLKADIEDTINQSIADGGTTMVLRLDDVGPDDNAKVPGALYHTVPNGAAPTFTESDHFTARTTDVDGAMEPLVRFPNGYMSGGVWVSGGLDADRVLASMPGFASGDALIDLPQAVITFDVKTGRDGVIAGAVTPDVLLRAIDPGLQALGICPGDSTHQQIALTIHQSVDVVPGAPMLQDVTRECSGISFGIGFDVKPTGSIAGFATPPKRPSDCL